MTPSERCVRRQPSAAISGCSPRAAARAASTCSSPRGSGGRAWLGIGAGYHGEEAQALDLPLPPVAERFERLEETLQIAIRMWADDETPFEGMHYRLRRPVDSPRAGTAPPSADPDRRRRRTQDPATDFSRFLQWQGSVVSVRREGTPRSP
jgi:Luciferase-like monooxygenase